MKHAIIIGAGPAGLTAAYELIRRTDIIPIIIEKSSHIGGLSKTVNYKGNKIDIGGHRFFSKSDRVMDWWLKIMPLATAAEQIPISLTYHNQSYTLEPSLNSNKNVKNEENIMLVRTRLSRIYFLRKFFDYPIKLSPETLKKLGLTRSLAILFSYVKASLFPIRPEKSLEDFFINRFGRQLYQTFFKDYTEKVWGVPCTAISSEWGAQRIKGVSIRKALAHAIKQLFPAKSVYDVQQKNVETSLIERFLYPKYGPGHLWEEVAGQIEEMGGKIYLNHDIVQIFSSDNIISDIEVINLETEKTFSLSGVYFFSSMPIKELVEKMPNTFSEEVCRIASGLQYRDFITVGILLKKQNLNKKRGINHASNLQDNWIYIQESDVKVGRLQIFNNWSPFMVKDADTVWIGMEYFCNTGDILWNQNDSDFTAFAVKELESIGLIYKDDVLDTTILRVEKAYPAYWGTYKDFHLIREATDTIDNLFLIGRNGMHKYNNSDHSMLTAMTAVDNICNGVKDKSNIWSINTEEEYHEEK